ncbi:MAG TPA: hypothetical protein VF620_14390 [Allosphingosinicella sp.]|jgi:type VI protein secretion system component VasF
MTHEAGFLPEEIERGEDRPGCHLPLWTCLPLAAAALLVSYMVYRLAIWVGFTAAAAM